MELVRAQDAAHGKIVRAVVPVVSRGPCRLPDLPDHDLVGLEKPCQLTRRRLPPTRRPWNARDLGDIGCHRDAHAPEQLDALGDVIDELIGLWSSEAGPTQ